MLQNRSRCRFQTTGPPLATVGTVGVGARLILWRWCLDSASLELLSASHVYDMQALTTLVERISARNIDHDSIADMLQAADLYESQHLKRSCFKYVKANSNTVLVQYDFITISSQNPTLWLEMSQAIAN